MKKLKLSFLLIAMAVSVMSAEAKLISFGPSAGLNKSNFSLSGNSDAITNHMGYQLGLDATIDLALIKITPGIQYTNNTFTVNNGLTDYVSNEVTSRSFSVPVIFSLGFFGPLSIDAGPVFVLSENNKTEYTVAGISTKSDIGDLRKEDSYVVGLSATMFGIKGYVRYQKQFGTTWTDFGDMKYGAYSFGVSLMF